jgi:hypothetical protein
METVIMKNAILLLMMLCLSPAAMGQVSRVVTNGELEPERAFHCLVMHDQSNASAAVVTMLRQPRSQAMQQWMANCDLKLLDLNKPENLLVAKSHHQDLLAKHRNELPIVALVDGTGGVWWSESGTRVASMSEAAIASAFTEAYAATIRAAQASGQEPPVRADNRPAQSPLMPSPSMQYDRVPGSGGSYFMPRNMRSERQPLFNPKLDIAVPDTITTQFNLATNVIVLLIGGGFIAIVCCLILSCGRVMAAAMTSEK